jgi:hypothetical protein
MDHFRQSAPSHVEATLLLEESRTAIEAQILLIVIQWRPELLRNSSPGKIISWAELPMKKNSRMLFNSTLFE